MQEMTQAEFEAIINKGEIVPYKYNTSKKIEVLDVKLSPTMPVLP